LGKQHFNDICYACRSKTHTLHFALVWKSNKILNATNALIEFEYEANTIGTRGATSCLFRGEQFMKFHSMVSSCLYNRGTTFSQMVTDKDLFAAFPKMTTFQF